MKTCQALLVFFCFGSFITTLYSYCFTVTSHSFNLASTHIYSLSSCLHYFLSIKASGSCREHLPIKGRVCWGGSFKHIDKDACVKRRLHKASHTFCFKAEVKDTSCWENTTSLHLIKRHSIMILCEGPEPAEIFFKNCNNNISNNCLCIYSYNEKWELFRITRISVLISHTEWLIIIYFTITHCCL